MQNAAQQLGEISGKSARPEQVTEAMERLHTEITGLENAVESLRLRLQLVMIPAPPVGQAQGGQVRMVSSPLVETLCEHAVQIDRVRAALDDIDSRLTV